MSPPRINHSRSRLQCLLAAILLGLLLSSASGAVPIYSTGFETTEGFNIDFNLSGQGGWTGTGSGGNGVTTNFIAGLKQNAYIGFEPPLAGFSSLGAWHPLNYHPISSNTPVVTFSVVLEIVDSSNGKYDDFNFAVYNVQGNRLFTLDFDNNDFHIYYALDGTNNDFVYTGWSFNSSTAYLTTITMDFASNTWSAVLAGAMIVTNRPLTTANAEMSLGYVAAEWVLRTAGAAGNNFMVFDDYKVTAVLIPPQPPQLRVTTHFPDGSRSLRLTGQSNYYFAIDASTNMANWIPLKTNVTTGGYFDFVDAAPLTSRFYRARWTQ